MCAIAKRVGFASFAAAKVDHASIDRLISKWQVLSLSVSTVTKRRHVRQPTLTKQILSAFFNSGSNGFLDDMHIL